MATKTKRDQFGFHQEKRGRKKVWVKLPAGGGEVHRDGECFEAFDNNGNFLGGLISTQVNAEHAAQHGYVVTLFLDAANDLDLWQAWNSAVGMGRQVLLAEDGTQIIYLGYDVWMSAKPDRRGYDVALLDDTDMSDRYFDELNQCYHLKIVSRKEDRLILE